MNANKQLALGAFFLVTIGILAFFTLFLTDFDPFGDPIQLRVAFPEANQVRKGDPVMIQGLRIGRVDSLEYVEGAGPDEQIHAILNLDREIELLEDATVVIEESTMLGGRQIEIHPGTPGGPAMVLGEDDWVRGYVQLNPFDQLGAIGMMLDENSVAFKAIVDDFEAIIGNTREGKGTIGRLLMNEEMGAEFQATIENLRLISDNIQAGRGMLGALINDESMTTQLRTTVANVESVSDALANGQGLAGRLINDNTLAEKVTEGLESFASVGQRIERGEGVLGLLLTDPDASKKVAQVLDDVAAAGSDIRQITSVLAAGEGSIGKLMMDTEMYDQLSGAIGLLTRSLEDYREAAPISTFTSVLFTGF